MATEQPGICISRVAGADLSSSQYYIVDLNSSNLAVLCGDGASAIGVLQNNPALGEEAKIMISGLSKVVAGAAIDEGALLASDASGKAITAIAADFAIGMCTQAAGADTRVGQVALGVGCSQLNP